MSEDNPLDLNNLPMENDERHQEGKQVLELEDSCTTVAVVESNNTRGRKKRKGGKQGIESEKIYECRFCSLKFGKSQALGGHMNRHRQEKETEILNRARQLVYSENLARQGSYLGCNTPSMNFPLSGMGDLSLSLSEFSRQPRPSSSSVIPPPPPPPPPTQATLFTYSSYPSTWNLLSFPSRYSCPPTNSYFVGSGFHPTQHPNPNYATTSNYTCIGAPISHGYPTDGTRAAFSGRGTDSTQPNIHEDGINLD